MTVPNLEGRSADEAESALQSAGLTGNAREEYSDTVEAGVVISQDVDAGSEVSPGSSVGYVVSRGPEMTVVSVPGIVGMDQNTAEKTLQQYGLTPSYTGESYSDYPAGQVYYQSVSEGTQVEEGTTVEFGVSLGPEPEPEQPAEDPGTSEEDPASQDGTIQ